MASLAASLRAPVATAGSLQPRSTGSRLRARGGRGRTAKQPKRHGFTPFVAPTSPPQGTYDPTLDANQRASDRGWSDYQSDYTRDTGRRESDYLLARGTLQQSHDNSLADLLRNYGNLATSQTEAANAAGLLGGGWQAGAAAVRGANQGRDQTRLEQDFSRRFGSLDLGHTREAADASQALTRAGREHTQFGIDTGAARFYQAAGTGYAPPTAPGNEHVQGGQAYRQLGPNRYQLPSGKIVDSSGLARQPGYGFSLYGSEADLIKKNPALARAMGLIK